MPMPPSRVTRFLGAFRDSLEQGTFVTLVLASPQGPGKDLLKTTLRKVTIRGRDTLSFVDHYRTRDITRNLEVREGGAEIEALLGSVFKTAHLFLSEEEMHLDLSKPGKTVLTSGKPSRRRAVPTGHDRTKRRHLDPSRPFLHALGITDARGRVLPSMSHKWKQIDKFVEILAHAVASSALSRRQTMHLVDFGAGKGYLTFAAHDYLRHNLGLDARVTGIELRKDLVAFCNAAAAQVKAEGLCFREGTLESGAPAAMDALVALHACDTATDLALYMGIRAGAEVMLCAPCCHKELRPQLHAPPVLTPLLRFGIHQAQEADMVTDSLRALLLEWAGYRVAVFEFVALEHTSKNKMISAVKRPDPVARERVQAQIAALKEFYGIRRQRLETLLKADPSPPPVPAGGP